MLRAPHSSRTLKALSVMLLMLLSLTTPFSEVLREDSVQAAGGGSRHIYTFADGSAENIALYQGANPDRTTKLSIPRGAEVTDFEITLSGASSTGWSQLQTDTWEEWMKGTSAGTDSRSGDLSLALSNPVDEFTPFSQDVYVDNRSDSWFDNGTFSIRQPHTSSALESRFSEQVKQTNTSFMAQGQGAIVKNHDWLFMSTWTSSTFNNIVHRLYPNNATRESVIHLDQAGCTIPQKHSSSYYGQYGFRDWTITDDEVMYAILSGYKSFHSSSIPTQYHRVLKLDVSDDSEWVCLDSYDISPAYGDYTAISWDRGRDVVWVVHHSQRRVVPYTFGVNGGFERGENMYSFSSSSGSSWECGKSGQITRGLVVNGSYFYMRCQKGQYYQDKDQLNAWAISGSSTSLVPQAGTLDLSALGNGLTWDGKRFHALDCGYSTWSGNTLYYRQFGTGWQYPTTPAPGTTTWFGEVIETEEDVVAINMETYWSASSTGDRVDHWISADNGTHWEKVTSNETIHFQHPGKELIWKIQLIGSSAISWWVDLEYATSYESSGDWTSKWKSTGTKGGKVRPVWTEVLPQGTDVQVFVSNDNGSTWLEGENGQEVSFSTSGAGNQLRWNLQLTTTDQSLTPLVEDIVIWYEEGYPDQPELDIGNDGIWDWQGLLFLNESSVVASDDSEVGVDVSKAPSIVDSLNSHIPNNGVGNVEIPIAVRAKSSGRVKLNDLAITYRLSTRALDAQLDGGVITPNGEYTSLTVRVAAGDEVDKVTEASVSLMNSHGDNPGFKWEYGNVCTTVSEAGEIASFDSANCTSTKDSEGIVSIRIPMKVNWSWDDETKMEALISVHDDLGQAVNSWETEGLDMRIENDIQLDGLKVWDETGRELFARDWLRGGFNISLIGDINFQGTTLSPQAGQFKLQVHGQNLTYDGDPIGEKILLHEEANPAHGEYNMTLQTPMESSPGGMLFSVSVVELTNGSEYSNPGYNTILLILDGNAPLVLSATPLDGLELHKGPPHPGGQAVSIIVQDSVDPPTQLTLHYWLGCDSRHERCSDTNFNGLPEEIEYREKTLSTPEVRPGGLNIFEGLIDDSILIHGEKVTFYVSGKDGQNNTLAMGGSFVCPDGEPYCGDKPGEIKPDWDAPLSTYRIREEFEPVLDIDNSTLIGHEDRAPLHPGVPYTAVFSIADTNGWHDIEEIHFSLGGDFDDTSTSIFAGIMMDAQGRPLLELESGGSGLAVSNLYSSINIDPENASKISVSIRFQLTWLFDEYWDTDGGEYFLPKVMISDKPCNDGEITSCHQVKSGLGNDLWSLDNDLRFDAEKGHIKAIELRDGTNHYNPEFEESVIGAGQALRFSGRVLFSEDNTPAPSGAFEVVLGDYEYSWSSTTDSRGEFAIDLLIPSVRSGHLDLRARLMDLPGIAEDESPVAPRLRFAVDSQRPMIQNILLAGASSGEPIGISGASSVLVQLETTDDQGFSPEDPALLHYLVRAGNAEITRGSAPLPDVTPFGEQFFWSGKIDLTDDGATPLLPTYQVDVWVTGSDAAGNPFDSESNSPDDPIATFLLALSGPSIDLSAESTLIKWSNPSPTADSEVTLQVEMRNIGAKGQVTVVLENLVDGGNWKMVAMNNVTISTGDVGQVALPTVANGEPGETLEYRIRLLDDDVEMSRISISPLIITEEVKRDGEAFSEQIQQSQLSVILYLIALISMGFGVWTMVIHRRMLREDENDEADYTVEVTAQMHEEGKVAPDIPVADVNVPTEDDAQPTPLGPPPIPPEGLPPGWTEEQWNHYGHQWLSQKAAQQ